MKTTILLRNLSLQSLEALLQLAAHFLCLEQKSPSAGGTVKKARFLLKQTIPTLKETDTALDMKKYVQAEEFCMWLLKIWPRLTQDGTDVICTETLESVHTGSLRWLSQMVSSYWSWRSFQQSNFLCSLAPADVVKNLINLLGVFSLCLLFTVSATSKPNLTENTDQPEQFHPGGSTSRGMFVISKYLRLKEFKRFFISQWLSSVMMNSDQIIACGVLWDGLFHTASQSEMSVFPLMCYQANEVCQTQTESIK